MRVLLHNDKTELFLDLFETRFPALEIACCNSYDGLPDALAAFQPDALFCIKFEARPYPRDAVMACPSIKWIGVGGVGVDHIMPWDPAERTVTNGAGVASEVIAYYVIGGVIALAMHFPLFARRQPARSWQWEYVGEIAGRTLAILGLGHTGQAVARLAKGIGLRVIGTRAHPTPTPNVDRVFAATDLYACLAEADDVAVCTPLLPSTRHLIDEAAVAAMKPGAGLIDVARGGVVDGAALIAGLQSGQIGGAVIDVFDPEPMPDDCPLWDMDNVLITPHCSSIYRGWERKAAEKFCDNLQRWCDGQPLVNVVDPARGY